MVGAQRFAEPATIHDQEGQAICETPVLVCAALVQRNSGAIDFGIERNHFDAAVVVRAPVPLGRHDAGGGIRESV
jgi:hypothetical protein